MSVENKGENLSNQEDLENDDKELDDFITNFNPEEDVDEDDDEGVVKIKKEDFEKLNKGLSGLQTTIRQKQHWREKATKSNSLSTKPMSNPIEEVKPPEIKPSVSNEPAVTPASPKAPQRDLEKEMDIIKLAQEYPHLEKDADEFISLARQLNLTIEQALEHKVFQPFIEKAQKEYDLSHVSLSSRSAGATVPTGSSTDYATMSREEMEKKNQEVRRKPRA